MDGPRPKRLRLKISIPFDPSIPLENGSSPFQNAPQDIIEHIFRHVTANVKTKMGLERVCSKFGNLIISPRCWIWNNKLTLQYCKKKNKVSINRTSFDENMAPNALAIFLQRVIIRKVEFQSTEWPVDVALGLKNQIVAHRQSFNLQSFEFSLSTNAVLNNGCATLLSGLAECDLNQLKRIEVAPEEFTGEFQIHFWSFVFVCPNLTSLELEVPEGTGVQHNVNGIISHCPNIETLKIINCDCGFGVQPLFAPLINNLQKLKSIHLAFVDERTLIDLFDHTTVLGLELNQWS